VLQRTQRIRLDSLFFLTPKLANAVAENLARTVAGVSSPSFTENASPRGPWGGDQKQSIPPPTQLLARAIQRSCCKVLISLLQRVVRACDVLANRSSSPAIRRRRWCHAPISHAAKPPSRKVACHTPQFRRVRPRTVALQNSDRS